MSEEGWRDTYLVPVAPLLHAPVFPGEACSTCCVFFPMAVSCSEVIPFNFGYLSCVSTIHPFGEQSFSPGLKTGGFYFLAESPWILLRPVITFLELGCIYNGAFVPLWLSALNNRLEG